MLLVTLTGSSWDLKLSATPLVTESAKPTGPGSCSQSQILRSPLRHLLQPSFRRQLRLPRELALQLVLDSQHCCRTA